MIEKRALRRNPWKENHKEEILERSIWDASGWHPGGIQEASGRLPGGIWEASERHLGLQAAMGQQEAPNLENRWPSQLNAKVASLD